ncbi:hypothetical protein F5148DRAFT_1286228 [Russula earlei]|uniref:Uncharacterized protein n=1 Tax=Russula earlei TaxID=71964 RepID=A0ACC0U5K9_9AGAM|nr:hypothetical protein F5148DRAFT_1286228 [Russula earlei]
METTIYLTEFEKAANSLDKKLLTTKKLEIETGVWLESVVLRLQKKTWVNDLYKKPQSGAGIFFSIWVSDKAIKAIKENKILYNIHALKLRELHGYRITSREFADAFRQRFQPIEHLWPNVSVNFGPLTLMEGWVALDTAPVNETVYKLASQFLEIDSMIDELLQSRKLPGAHRHY